ncbi:hypothetical protein FNF29_05824 [Cafeteria roenbergensis]|nr:hypothetical protein FNF29_05824 [Cafeteria roenbergensis]KAA0163972.1 hypothetical protein FNF31_02521 [Cafeteria roenbergensis]|eukprot:KAA0149612.1 hypothetical protein FNF29_05824 [Cafeteria roenbergensis]
MCSNRGDCDFSTGVCKCQRGFEGRACERTTCPRDCSNMGVCVTMRRNAERTAFSGGNWVYASNWDADKVVGCDCDREAGGYDCSMQLCPRGDDPMTSGQEHEVQLLNCTMAAPSAATYFSVTLDGEATTQIPTNGEASTLRDALAAVVGTVSVSRAPVGATTTLCSPAGELHLVTFVQRHGDVPAMRINVDVESTAPGATIVVTDATGEDAVVTINHPTGPGGGQYSATVGTREWDVCSGRGTCDDSSGACHCFKGFDSSNGFGGVGTRGDCGYASSPITSCPGTQVECSGHGTCSGHPTYKCTCDNGWMGGDCAQRTCPAGPAWFDSPVADDSAHAEAECSNRGHCNRETSLCACHPGFTGEACERLACPRGGPGMEECSAHGRCASMSQLAAEADTNGDPTPFRYGSASPGLTTAWDGRAAYGCLCDDGFEGYACSKRSCPTGDDPHSPGMHETQELVCTAPAAGTVALTFRGRTTAALPTTATPAELQAALEALDTVEKVAIACTSTTAVCSVGGNTCRVEFLLPLGDLPAMSATATGTGVTAVVNAAGVGASVNGTTENAECSNRGICDFATGQCQCFVQYGSSDGTNSPGTRGDCGYVEPYVPVGMHKNPWDAAEKMWRLRGSWGSHGHGNGNGHGYGNEPVGSKGTGVMQGMLAKWLAKA